jgi:hypothetical protein
MDNMAVMCPLKFENGSRFLIYQIIKKHPETVEGKQKVEVGFLFLFFLQPQTKKLNRLRKIVLMIFKLVESIRV